MMLSGEYVTLNSHWEDWNLPTWHHPKHALNMTTVNLVNELSRKEQYGGFKKIQAPEDAVYIPSAFSEPGLEATSSPPFIEASINAAVSPETSFQATAASPTTDGAIDRAPALAAPGAEHTARLEVTGVASLPPENSPPPKGPSTKPRFPETHPISRELFALQEAAAVIHFSAIGKPWTVTADMIKPDAHSALAAQFRVWRETAAMVCPAPS